MRVLTGLAFLPAGYKQRRLLLREINEPDVAAELLKEMPDFVQIVGGQKSHDSLLRELKPPFKNVISVRGRFEQTRLRVHQDRGRRRAEFARLAVPLDVSPGELLYFSNFRRPCRHYPH